MVLHDMQGYMLLMRPLVVGDQVLGVKSSRVHFYVSFPPPPPPPPSITPQFFWHNTKSLNDLCSYGSSLVLKR